MNDQTRETLKQGALGIVSTAGGTAVSLLAQIEVWLRIASLIVGIAVGIATFVSILKKLKGGK